MGCENVSFFPYGCEMISKLRNDCEMISKLRNNCEMISKLQNGYEMISKLQNGLWKCFFFPLAAKWFPNFKMAAKWFPSFKMAAKWFLSFKMGCENVSFFPLAAKWAAKMFLFFPFCYEMASKLQNGYEMAFRLQKLTCKRKGGLRKHLAKPREVAKMPIEPHNHASKEESPLTEITHTKPLTPFQTS